MLLKRVLIFTRSSVAKHSTAMATSPVSIRPARFHAADPPVQEITVTMPSYRRLLYFATMSPPPEPPITKGTLVSWSKTTGDSLEEYEDIVTIEPAREGVGSVTVKVPKGGEGIVTQLLVKPGETVTEGQHLYKFKPTHPTTATTMEGEAY